MGNNDVWQICFLLVGVFCELLFIMFPLIKIFFKHIHLFQLFYKESPLSVIGTASEQIINLECCSIVLPNTDHVPISGEGKKKWRTMKEICISFITGTNFFQCILMNSWGISKGNLSTATH